MLKETIKNVIVDQRELMEALLNRGEILGRDGLETCRNFLKAPNVLLISGLRRAGKSIFAHLIARSLIPGRARYASLNFDDERLLGLAAPDLNTILECFHELYGDVDALLLDEIQNIEGWELFVSRLRTKYRLIVTGSNAHLLSAELATHLTGRFIAFPLFPLSFPEFLRLRHFDREAASPYSTRARGEIAALFSQYVEQGGIFEHYQFGPEFLRELFSSIIAKDIVVRYKILYPMMLEELALLLVTQFSSKISVQRLTKQIGLRSPHTTKEYIKHLETSFLLFTVGKFSYKLKEQQTAFKKVYVTDQGLIHSLSFAFSENRGRLLENIVAIELKRQSLRNGFELYYWDDYNHECDFVVKRGRKIVDVYQACGTLTATNRDREVTGLLGAMKSFHLKRGFILTESTEDEIRVGDLILSVVPLWKWLIQSNPVLPASVLPGQK